MTNKAWVATVVVLLVFAFDRWWRSRSMNEPGQPVRWGMLWLCAWIAALSHILLDWTNNYGVRPFFPFNPRWYAGGIVFIFEPLIFAALLLALVAPALTKLIDGEVGARRQQFRGRGWAVFALVFIVALWGWRAVEQHSAKQILLNDEAAQDGGPVQVTKLALSPYPVNPFMWQAVVETPGYYRVATVDARSGAVQSAGEADIFYKQPDTAATLAAKQSWLGHVYLDWAQFPVVQETGIGQMENGEPVIRVGFQDLRFDYGPAFMGGHMKNALQATAYVNATGQVLRMQVGERIQK